MCAGGSNATRQCVSGSCTFACLTNFYDCDGDPTNGCEINLQNDAANCGACGNACAGTVSACSAAHCNVIVASQMNGLAGIAADGAHVYFTASTDGNVMRVDPDGSNLMLLAPNQSQPMAIATDGANAYFVDPIGQNVTSVGIDGSNLQIIASGLNNPVAITYQGGMLYWVTQNDGAVVESTPDGLTQTVLAMGETLPMQIVSDGVNAYWSASQGLRMASIDGTTLLPTTLIADVGVSAVGSDGTFAYWADMGLIQRVMPDGTQQTSCSQSPTPANGIVSDGSNVYWIDQAGNVKRAAVDGSSLTVLAGGDTPPALLTGIALDAQNVYWLNAADGTVHAATK